jgi:outer membrane PBP1 activator LpoA protein
MKSLTNIIGMAGLAAAFCVGCQQSDTAEVDAMAPEETVEEVSIEETVTETAETAKQVISEANAKAQEILTQAQALVGEEKYEEAGNLLQKLADLELTPEQQKMLDNLKATIQKAMESGAVKEGAKAIGGMMGGE